MNLAKKINVCRICKSKKLYHFLDLGKQPIPNGFLKKEQLILKENFFKLACFFCRSCGLVQLTHVVSPALMFKNYAYIPSGAKMMLNNFSNLAYQANHQIKLSKSSLCVDIGSNDGSLLKFFKAFEAKVLGIDPAQNLADVAIKAGIPTEVMMFNEKTADRIIKSHGKADIITATNVVAHIDNLHSLLKGILKLLKNGGIFITEFPYLLDLVAKNQFDTIYHEHLSYFSLKPWLKLISGYGFEIAAAQRLQIHGGSIRLTHRRRRLKHISRVVKYLVDLEARQGLHSAQGFEDFSKRIFNLKDQLRAALKNLKDQGKRVVGLGAPAKGNVLTSFFNIGVETLDYIVDSTPLKHGLFSPGKHIPIFPESRLLEDRPDYGLILAWNFSDEIIKKHEKFKKIGGKFIIPIPEVRII
ncbi:methyltransferase domain-containing protein [Candidatus Daviesbacteria bacterium]|nr:methyltransferase domain-containing protein [Candidatus Daviesbacteria bacterium]